MNDQIALDLETDCRARRDDGMARAARHADAVSSAWSAGAYGHLVEFVATVKQRGGDFMAEDVRAYAAGRGLPPPPDPRAWGVVMKRGAIARPAIRGRIATRALSGSRYERIRSIAESLPNRPYGDGARGRGSDPSFAELYRVRLLPMDQRRPGARRPRPQHH